MQKRSICCRQSLPPLEKVSVSPKHCDLFKVASWSLRALMLFHFHGESRCYVFLVLLNIFAHVQHFKNFFKSFHIFGTLALKITAGFTVSPKGSIKFFYFDFFFVFSFFST